jgi:uncharacterized membrane protein
MTHRFHSVDALRGLIMIFMAIDHASAFIARQHASEFWAGAMSSYTAAFPFLTRLVTHLCAPGFFFLMGAGVYWFAASRRQAGWTDAQIARRTAIRGLAVVLTGQLLETPVLYIQTLMKPAAVSLNKITAPPPIDGSELYWGFITLTGLGLALIACAALIRLPRWTWLLTSALCIFATNTLLPADGKIGPLWQAVLLTPGLTQHVIVIYPVIPWLAGAAAGLYFGYWWKHHPAVAERRFWLIAIALLIVGIALRSIGGWGNIRPPRDAGWIEFLNNVKYPPSLVFWCFSLGVDLLLLALLIRLPESWKSDRSPLIVFGQTPLFFYLAHFYLLAAFGLTVFKEAGSLEMAYAMWTVVLVLMYPLCLRYRTFKMAKPPESLWRVF